MEEIIDANHSGTGQGTSKAFYCNLTQFDNCTYVIFIGKKRIIMKINLIVLSKRLDFV